MNESSVSKIVRPSMFVWSYVLLTVAMLCDGNVGDFVIKEAYLPIIETIVVTITIAYVGSKAIERTTTIVKGK